MSLGKIVAITEVHDLNVKNQWNNFDGFKIITEKVVVQLLISNGQNCCENWGYLSTNDNVLDFLESELLDVRMVDTSLKNKPVAEYMNDDEFIFVNLETSKGTLQIAVYNSHNGYYGHKVLFIVDDSIKELGI